MANTKTPKKGSKNSGGGIAVKLILLVLVVVAGGLGYAYYEAQKEIETLSNPAVRNEEEIEEVIEQLSRHMVLPAENPQIATVVDAESLRQEQEFYADVENGDKIIVFLESRRAVAFSPDRDIIVNVGSLLFEEPVEEASEEVTNEEVEEDTENTENIENNENIEGTEN